MEYIDGNEILDEIAEAHKFDEDMGKVIYKQVLEGLAYLHEKDVCHRDIKPSNIMITKDQ